VTLCAHREFIQFAKGNPFGATGARAGQASPTRELIEERMQITAEKCPCMRWDAAVIMPDHFHALISMEGGHASLGDVVGGFKAAVTREIRRGNACLAPTVSPAPPIPKHIRIWHRNYYEKIVRDAEAEARIAHYIRMNPWRLVVEGHWGGESGGNEKERRGRGRDESESGGRGRPRPYRGIGNPALLNLPQIGMLCSRDCPADVLAAACARAAGATREQCFIGGFHSAPERAILAALLASEARVICCPAWGIDKMSIPSEWLPALEANRMMIVEMGAHGGDLASSRERNAFVMHAAEALWLPHVSPLGMLAQQVETLGVRAKVMMNGAI
jgi:REP element-mobilizing transposase RayT